MVPTAGGQLPGAPKTLQAPKEVSEIWWGLRFGWKNGNQAWDKQDQSTKSSSAAEHFLQSKAKRQLVIWGCWRVLYKVNTRMSVFNLL